MSASILGHGLEHTICETRWWDLETNIFPLLCMYKFVNYFLGWLVGSMLVDWLYGYLTAPLQLRICGDLLVLVL